MAFTLRPYQQRCVDAALEEVRRSVEPCLIEAAPAAGKSYMIAAIAAELNRISGKRVLCLAPSAELVKQNHQKYLLTGERASIFSASAGAKSTRHVVVFGTPKTVANAISRFTKYFCAVVVDECHGLTPTIRDIIDTMRRSNPNLRVIGLSGTPYRLGSGYVFRVWPDGRTNGDDTCRDPYFTRCVYRVSAREMLEEGFITPMTIGQINADDGAYDTSGIHLLPNGQPNPDDIERAFVGHGRKTAGIVADVINQVQGRPGGVMFFAATVRHAQEIMASLPPGNSALVTGETRPSDRRRIIQDYRDQRFRYLVSVGTLTTGFDVEHTGTIALLRYTESAALLQQILGRAWRLHPDKRESLLLDYAGNIERHFPDGDIYQPAVKASGGGGEGGTIQVECPDCLHINEFRRHKDYLDYETDKNGYCLDVFGELLQSEFGPVPGHYGRRCFGMIRTGSRGEYERCNYRWNGKECPECGEINDIAARYCYACKGEIVDPNERLVAEFKALKRDPSHPQTDRVLSMNCKEGVSRAGNRTLRVDWVTPYRQFSTWFQPDGTHPRAVREWKQFQAVTAGSVYGRPETVSYVKDRDSGFFRVLAYNQPADEEPAVETRGAA
jgi:DNA repair protein RadD